MCFRLAHIPPDTLEICIMYRARTTVRVPAGLGMGQLIGQQGSSSKQQNFCSNGC